MSKPTAREQGVLINMSVLGVISTVIATLGSTIIKASTVLTHSFDVLIHGVNAANHIAYAVEQRAEIYGDGMVSNGALAEREIKLKSAARIRALEEAEALADIVTPPADIKPVKVKPATSRKTKASKATKTKAA